MPLELSDAQVRSINIAERITSAISLLGLTFIITTFIFSDKFRKPINRLMFYAAWGDAIYNVATLIGMAGIGAGVSSGLCQFQGFVIEMFLLSDTLWNLSMAINVWLTVFRKYDAYSLRKLELRYLAINYGLPFVVALILCFVADRERGKVYGGALIWCWVSLEWDYLRIVLLYGPVWVLIFAIVIIYAVAGIDIFKKHRALRDFSSSNHSRPRSTMPTTSFKTTEVHISTELADFNNPDSTGIAGIKYQHADGAEHVPAHYVPYNVTITGDAGAGKPADLESASDSQPPMSKPQKTAMSEKNNAAWAYTKCAIMFFLALLITWLPSTINRVYSLIYPDRISWALNLTAAIVLPLMGFWNTVIYIFTSKRAIRALIGRQSSSAPHIPATRSRHPQSPPWTRISRGRYSVRDDSEENLTNLTSVDNGGAALQKAEQSSSPPQSFEAHRR